MKLINPLFLAAIIVLFLNACNTQPRPAVDAATLSVDSTPEQRADTTVKDPLDTASNNVTRFALTAFAGNIMEMAMGNTALQTAQNPRVKKFGEMMAKDHLSANKMLISLAEINHINLPSKTPARTKSSIKEIRRFKGEEFDRRYMLMMTDHHQKEYDLFEKTARHLRDTTFKDYISKTLSVIRVHLDSAKAIKNEL
jgi:putative membrane protein